MSVSGEPTKPAATGRCRGDRGSSTLELAGLLPLVLVVLVALIHGGLAVYGTGAVSTAARQGARAASLGESPYAAVDAALPGWLPATVTLYGPGHGVRVRGNLPDVIPGFDLAVSRSAEMP